MLSQYMLLCLAAFAGGAVNSIAGGGTLLTLPALFAALGSTASAAVLANGTSTVALVPGVVGAVWAYRRELTDSQPLIRLLLPVCILGGILGAVLVVALPAESFEALVPWLILAAAVLFAVQPQISRWIGIGKPSVAPHRHTKMFVVLLQFVIAIYGGYFGAGIGILTLAGLGIMGLSDIHHMNGVKSILAGTINAVAAAVFIVHGNVDWRLAGMMSVAAIIGGYGGASIARKVDRNVVRALVVLIGFSLAGYYMYKQWFS